MSVYDYLTTAGDKFAQKSVISLDQIAEDERRLEYWLQMLRLETAKYVMFNNDGSVTPLDQHRLNEVNGLIQSLEGIRANNRSVHADFLTLVNEIEKSTGQRVRSREDIVFRCQRIAVYIGRKILQLAADLNKVLIKHAQIFKKRESVPRAAELLQSDEVKEIAENFDHDASELSAKLEQWTRYRDAAERILSRYQTVPLPPVSSEPEHRIEGSVCITS